MSIEAVRPRLGRASTETTQLYDMLDDKVADDEIRAAVRAISIRPLAADPVSTTCMTKRGNPADPVVDAITFCCPSRVSLLLSITGEQEFSCCQASDSS